MATLSIFSFFLLMFVLEKAVGDPCSTYSVMSGEIRRSTAYTLKPSDTAICDNFLTEQWYRIDSQAGNEIVRSCPSMTQCGTMYPMWMNGNLPLTSDGEVDRTVCQSGITGCCESSLTIKVKNCGAYYVYFLKKPSGCPISYCFGTLYVNATITTTTATTTTTTTTTTTAPPTTASPSTTTECDKDKKEGKEHRHGKHHSRHAMMASAALALVVFLILLTLFIFKLYKRKNPKTSEKVKPIDAVAPGDGAEKTPLPEQWVVVVPSAPPLQLQSSFIKKTQTEDVSQP